MCIRDRGSTSLFGTIALASKKKWVRIVCVIMFLMIGLSRMYLGVHTPKDVITAMVLALVVAWLVNKVLDSYLLDPRDVYKRQTYSPVSKNSA